MYTKLKLAFPLLMFLSLVGCGFSESIKDAEVILDKFFNQRIKEGSTGPEEYYSKYFFEATTQEEWRDIQALVNKANGQVKSYEQQSWRVHSRVISTELAGTFATFVYKVQYEKCEGFETIVLFKNDDNPDYKIFNHNYNSENIQKLINKGIKQAAQSEL